MAKVRIRKARVTDCKELVDACYALDQEDYVPGEEFGATTQNFRKWLFEKKLAHAFVAEVDGQFAGMTVYTTAFYASDGRPSLYVTKVYTIPAFRKLGVARGLMDAVVAVAAKLKYAKVVWGVHDTNRAALEFYARLGGRKVDDVSMFYLPAN